MYFCTHICLQERMLQWMACQSATAALLVPTVITLSWEMLVE